MEMTEISANKPHWTAAQLSAMEAQGHPVLVSAAAGSGKTAVLCERILRQLLQGESISRMLIVTFTRAAAAQLREKLRSKLQEAILSHPEAARHLRRQLTALPAAKISTIDSFYLDLMHTYFQTLGISAGVRILDEQENAALCAEHMAETVERHSRTEDACFTELLECFGGSDAEEQFLSYRQMLLRHREGYALLQSSANNLRETADLPLYETPAGTLLYAAVKERFADWQRKMEAAAEEFSSEDPVYGKYGKLFAYCAEFAKTFCAALESRQEAVREVIGNWNPPDLLGGKRVKEEDKTPSLLRAVALRKTMHEQLTPSKTGNIPIAAELFLSLSPEENRAQQLRLADLFDRMYLLLTDFEEVLWQEKKRLGVLDYTDMTRLTLQLLQDENGSGTAVARELSDRYRWVCVDEYQDTSDLQDAVFSLLAPVNRFMVGDIKQSIYRFRGACPEVFEAYRRSYPLRGEGVCLDKGEQIPLSHNFRCDRSVIEFSNRVCGRLFGVCRGLRYLPEQDDLQMGKSPEKDRGLPVRLLLCDRSTPEPPEGMTKGSVLLTKELRRLLGEGYRPGEIAVLVRSLKNTEAPLRAALAAAGIPFSIGYEAPPDHRPEMLLLHSLLRMGDNPYRDIDLVAAMYSPVFSFTMEELVQLKTAYGAKNQPFVEAVYAAAEKDTGRIAEKCRKLLAFIADCRQWDKMMSPDRLLLRLLERYHLLPLLSAAKTREEQLSRKQALLQYYEFARTYAANGKGGLGGMLTAADRMMSEKVQREEPGDPDCVRVMTIHKSKGLEFPVTILYGCEKGLGGNPGALGLQYDPTLGVCADLLDESRFAKIRTPGKAACKILEQNADIEESVRVLYVAMTRAIHQLILLGDCPTGGSKNPKYAADLLDSRFADGEHLTFESLRSHQNYLDWILMAVQDPQMAGAFQIVMPGELQEPRQTPPVPELEPEAEPAQTPDSEAVSLARERFAARLGFQYPAAIAATLPAKLSVTRLEPDLLDDLSGADLLRSEDFRTPRFVEEALSGGASRLRGTAAERGSATHEFMQFCDFDRCRRDGVAAERDRLVEAKFLSPVTGARVELPPVEAFFASELYAEMRNAKRIWREQRFNICLPAEDFTGDPGKKEALAGQELLIQGVIDCFFETVDGKLVLLDYKTDRFSAAERRDLAACEAVLRKRHGLQLRYYAIALRQLLGRPVDRVLIWSFGLDRPVEMKEECEI